MEYLICELGALVALVIAALIARHFDRKARLAKEAEALEANANARGEK